MPKLNFIQQIDLEAKEIRKALVDRDILRNTIKKGYEVPTTKELLASRKKRLMNRGVE